MILPLKGNVLRSLRERLMVEVLYYDIGQRPHPPWTWAYLSAIAGGFETMANVMMIKAMMDHAYSETDCIE